MNSLWDDIYLVRALFCISIDRFDQIWSILLSLIKLNKVNSISIPKRKENKN